MLRRSPSRAIPAAACAALLLATGAARGETLIDAAQRKVELPAVVGAAVPASVAAQVLLHALAPGKLAGLVVPFTPEHAIYVDEALLALPQIPVLSRTSAPGDVAAVAALHPSLVLDDGTATGRDAAAAEAIQAELKVPTLLVSDDLVGAPDLMRRLGRALGVGGRGDAVAAAIGQVLKQVASLSALPDAERVPVYLARGGDGLEAVRAGGALDEAIRLAGGRNVVAAGGGEDGTFRTMTVAEVAALKPAVVIVAESEATHGALRDALPGDTRFVLDAGEPYKTLIGAPSINRIAGVLALAGILHPTRVAVEPDAAARIETLLFPIPPGLSVPSPLQSR